MRVLGAFVLGLVLTASTGCATFVTGGGPDQKIRITSEPNGARVYVDGNYRGTTPTSVSMTRVDNHLLRVELDGYVPFERDIRTGHNPWFWGNLVLAIPFIVPGIVGGVIDLLDGAVQWIGGDVHAVLDPVGGGPPPAPAARAGTQAPTHASGKSRRGQQYLFEY
jgi:hypothetical protein